MNESSSKPAKISLTYRDSGVDIDAGERLVDLIKPHAAATKRPGVLGGLGGFGALFEVPLDRYKKPVLVSGTDGVGTKLKLAIELNRHDTIGIDLVAMCVNDVIVSGAEPLFFLDYYATGKLEPDVAAVVIKGIAQGCLQAGAALSGGETAEMPGMYIAGDYDLAGFCVGVVEKDAILDGSRVADGDCLIGIASSGPHSNGYSLIRKIVYSADADLHAPFDDATLGDALIAPTRIYVKPLLALLQNVQVNALAHITGGGILENLPRVFPDHLQAEVDLKSWRWPNIFQWLADKGGVDEREMYRTFNCGVGMVVVVKQADADKAIALLEKAGERAWRLGRITPRQSSDTPVLLKP